MKMKYQYACTGQCQIQNKIRYKDQLFKIWDFKLRETKIQIKTISMFDHYQQYFDNHNFSIYLIFNNC